MASDLTGIYAASVTPFDREGKPASDQLIAHLQHLKRRGCHGVLLCGTTGEAQSLSVDERVKVVDTAAKSGVGLRLLVGTGAASLEDAVTLTRAAYEHDITAVVVIPPFFYKTAPVEGLYAFFVDLIRRSVPNDGRVLLYHNPVATCTAIPFDLVHKLVEKFPEQVAGIKDSGSDLAHTRKLCQEFPGFQVLVGDDRYLADTLAAGGAGAITGLSNLYADMLVDVYNRRRGGESTEVEQTRLTETHRKLDGLPRLAAIKALLVAGKVISNVAVRPPLRPLTEAEMELLRERFNFGLKLAQVIDLDAAPGGN